MKKEQFETENYIGLYLWGALIVASLALYYFFPEVFTPANIRQFFDRNLYAGLLIYLLLASARGFTMIPLTPLLFAGILVFPPLPFLLINMVGIVVSSAFVYYLARYFRFDEFFTKHYPTQIARLTGLLQNRELPVIFLWSFAPIFPTDLIVYVCSVLRISITKTLLGVLAGETIICAVYIYGGVAGLSYFFE
ncbi:MAG: VTT domain-containing protein [Pseudomonadota bacterium]